MTTLTGKNELAKLQSLFVIEFANHLASIGIGLIDVIEVSRTGHETKTSTVRFRSAINQEYLCTSVHTEDFSSITFHTLPIH